MFVLTYLIVCNALEILERDVLTNRGHTERPVPILLFANHISAVWFHRLAKVMVWNDLIGIGLTVDAPGCVPGVFTLHVLDTVDEIGSPVSLSLT